MTVMPLVLKETKNSRLGLRAISSSRKGGQEIPRRIMVTRGAPISRLLSLIIVVIYIIVSGRWRGTGGLGKGNFLLVESAIKRWDRANG